MTKIQSDIMVRGDNLGTIYGSQLIGLPELSSLLGVDRRVAKRWADEHSIGIMVGRRIRYDVYDIAEALVRERGMC